MLIEWKSIKIRENEDNSMYFYYHENIRETMNNCLKQSSPEEIKEILNELTARMATYSELV